MHRFLLAAGALMLAVGLMSTTVHAQDTGAKKADTESAKEAEAAKATVHKATIDGMKWGVSWVKAVDKTVTSLEGVEEVDIDYEKSLATITMKEGEQLSKEDLDKAFEGTRFSVSKFETEGEDAEAEQRSIHKATISGMKWGVSWVKAVNKTVSSLDGVETVEIDYNSKVVTITMEKGKKLDKETLEKAFEDTNFAVEEFETEGADNDDGKGHDKEEGEGHDSDRDSGENTKDGN